MARQSRHPLGAAGYAARRARDRFRHPFSCSICGKRYPTLSRWKADAERHLPRWNSKKARQAARNMGRDRDQLRRQADAGLRGYGLRDRSGQATARSLSRPGVPATPRLKDWKQNHRHHQDNERADRHDEKARVLRAKGRYGRAQRHEDQAAGLRGRWPPLRQAPPARPRAAPSPPRRPRQASRANGRQAPGRTPPGTAAPRTPAPPGRGGRLAPSRPGRTP